ncbi:cyclic nucleotide-gated cation channel alpha-4 [Corvus kubaryi]|uniref:cyclic nucleotide-gated cation channel alpha-4 n=1 Tax=Corvus kubaryi TaxID=68294 RepID=UPI001C053440|nr:cyclic nucleotide-gated cation channel alpha-4 [Corvus kubaryi]
MIAGPSDAPGNGARCGGRREAPVVRVRQGAVTARSCPRAGAAVPQPAVGAAHSGILRPGATETPGPGPPQAPRSRITGTPRYPGAGPPTWVKAAAVPSRQRRTCGGQKRRRTRGRDPPGPPGTPRAPAGLGPSPHGTAARSDPSPSRSPHPRHRPGRPGPSGPARPRAGGGPGTPGPRRKGGWTCPEASPALHARRSRCPHSRCPRSRCSGAPRPLPVRPSAAAHRPPPPRAPRSRRHLPAAPDAPRALDTPTGAGDTPTGTRGRAHRSRGYAHRDPGIRPPEPGTRPHALVGGASRESPSAHWLLRERGGTGRGRGRVGTGSRERGKAVLGPPGAGYPGTGPPPRNEASPESGNPSEPVTDNRVPRCCDSRHREPQYGHHPQPGTPLARASLFWDPPHTATPRNWTLDPAGDWHYRWISLMVLPILYNWVILILRCCFPEVQEAHVGLWQALDGLSDALYLLDMAVHLHTGFLEDGILVQDVSRTRRRYLGSWTFPWDVMAVLPTELLCLLPRVPRVPGVPAARANRCLRLPRLFEAFDRCETRTGWPNVFRVAKLMLYLLLGIHWHGCLYFALSAHLGLGIDPWVCPSFTRLLRRYLHSFYFSTLVLAMVGDTPAPQREEEFLFVTAGFLLAMLGFATITGNISAVIVNLSAADAAFYPDVGPMRRYLRARGAGRRLVRRVVRWHQHLRAQRKLPAEREVLQHLPQGLQAEVAASVHLAALRRVGLFRGWEHSVLRQLVLRLRPQVFSPGEFVCRRGDVGREMYFIREGRLAVVAEDGVTQLAVLGEGLYFGEISLINIKGNMAGNRRTANILSIGYSDLFCLGKEDLTEVLAEFPCARAAMEAKGRELLLRMGQLNTGAEVAAVAAEAERRLQGLEVALEGLQTRAARLLAQLEASALRVALRIQRLEGWLHLRQQRRDRAAGTDGAAGTASPQRPARTQGPTGGQGPPQGTGFNQGTSCCCGTGTGTGKEPGWGRVRVMELRSREQLETPSPAGASRGQPQGRGDRHRGDGSRCR